MLILPETSPSLLIVFVFRSQQLPADSNSQLKYLVSMSNLKLLLHLPDLVPYYCQHYVF